MMRKYLYILPIFLSLTVSAQKANNMIRRGNSAYNDRKYKDAEIDYKSSLEKDPQSFAGNYNLGNAYYKQKNYDEAGKQFLQSSGMSKNPSDLSRSYYNLGNTLMNAEKYQESLEAYKMALRLNPNDDDARYNLAYALSKLRQQQNKDQKNKDQKNQNKDQNKDQQQQQQQKQDQQKQDQQKQQQQDQQKQQQQKEQAKQQKSQPKISKEEAERMLQALKNEEQNLQKKKAKRFEATSGNPEKDW
jgi:tetratricopeptide (TPR) repeat protein